MSTFRFDTARLTEVEPVEQRVALVVLLNQGTKLSDRGLVGHRILAKFDAYKSAHGTGVINRLFGTRTGEL